jgi:hypothetical protein
MMFVVFNCAKSSLNVPKSQKRDAFSLFQSQTSIFHDEEPSFTPFPGEKKARRMLQLSPKFTMTPPSNKRVTRQSGHTDNKNKERPTHSKFKFQIQIARNHTRGSEQCEKDRTALQIAHQMSFDC